MKQVRITDIKHPHYGETGVLTEKDVPLSLSFLGKSDRIKSDDGSEFFAKPDQYKEL